MNTKIFFITLIALIFECITCSEATQYFKLTNLYSDSGYSLKIVGLTKTFKLSPLLTSEHTFLNFAKEGDMFDNFPDYNLDDEASEDEE